MPLEQRANIRLLYGAIGLVFALQLWLVFHKSMNWDEFFHFSQIYELQSGHLSRDLQVLHTRIFAWATHVPGGIMLQLQAARLGMLAFEAAALAALIGLTRRFFDLETALLAGLAWLGGGYVFLHGFSFRADPMATAALMGALYLLGARSLRWPVLIGIALLIGLAGMITAKSVLYAPCFAGLAWLRLTEADQPRHTALRLLAIAPLAGLTFYAVLLLHRSGLAVDHSAAQAITADRSRFFEAGLFPHLKYLKRQIQFAPVLALAIAAAPLLWRKMQASRWQWLAMAGLYLPLITLAFYRNAFPYYFVFLLAPIAVAAAPVLAWLRARLGLKWIVCLLLASPITLTVLEPRVQLLRQHAVIDHMHRLFPKPVGYLSWSGIIADYPRTVNFLTTGLGIGNYHRRGQPLIAEAIRSGQLRFIIADNPVLSKALAGQPKPDTLLAEDVAAMRGNFAQLAGPIWLRGVSACAPLHRITIERAGAIEGIGPGVLLDGTPMTYGETRVLSSGSHAIAASTGGCITLWEGHAIPPRPAIDFGKKIYTKF